MPSDNDDGSASSSGSACPSPAPIRAAAATVATMAAAGKGILVHNNRRSANTNRVSFMAPSSSSTTSASSRSPASSAPSTPSPPVKRPKDKQHGGQRQKPQQQQRRQSDAAGAAVANQLPYHMRTGRRLTGFGIKSYLHEFYDDPDDRRELFQDEDDDDFKYSVEPTEIRWRRHCGGVYAALGLAVTTVGLLAMAAGHWIPAKEPFVGRASGVEVIDQTAVEFNELLASCRYVGSAMFAAGVVFTVVRFWLSVIRDDRGTAAAMAAAAANDGKLASAAAVAAMDDAKLAAALSERLRRAQSDRRRSSVHRPLPQPPADQHTTVRIPVTGSVENVQPDPRAIHLRYDRAS